MDIIKAICDLVYRGKGLKQLSGNPYDERYTFIMNPDSVLERKRRENRMWYIGDSNELLNYYRNMNLYGNAQEPIYNINRAHYFWAIGAKECDIKRVHSGVPRAIVNTITNVVGVPQITIDGKEVNDVLEYIGFADLISQKELPFTLAEGWGAFKFVIDGNMNMFSHVLVQFYEAKDVEFITKNRRKIGIIFKDYYRYKGEDYVLLDVRRIDENGNSVVEYALYRQKGERDVEPVPMGTIPELANLQGFMIPNYPHILGVPCSFFMDSDNPDYGRSIFEGKIDLFDDLDQSLSQRSQTCRVSTPVEYFPADLLEKDSNGNPVMPSVYDRHFIKKPSTPDGEGTLDGSITTTQPVLNFAQYDSEQMALLNMILLGVLSPATMGLMVSKANNGMAQREKEKVTIMTRNDIINANIPIIREFMQVYFDLDEYFHTGSISRKERNISIKFNEFANPSFENLSATLYPMWVAGAISTRMYVSKLYGSSLSEREKEEEMKALDEQRAMELSPNPDDFTTDTESGAPGVTSRKKFTTNPTDVEYEGQEKLREEALDKNATRAV